MLLLDSIRSHRTGCLEASHRVTDVEFWCDGHFPGNPIFPGSLLIEMMAQAGGALLAIERDDPLHSPSTGMLLAVERARFISVVRPGAELTISAQVIAQAGRTAKVSTAVRSGQEGLVAQGRLVLRSQKGR